MTNINIKLISNIDIEIFIQTTPTTNKQKLFSVNGLTVSTYYFRRLTPYSVARNALSLLPDV